MNRWCWLVWLGVCLGAMAGCGPTTFVVGVSPGERQVTATVVEPAPGFRPDRVAIIDVSGMIYNAHQPGLLSEGDNPVSTFTEKLAAASRDHRVKAVILRINSPGGTVTASDAMYREVRRFREQSGKPVVAMMMDVAASGAYYLACSTDRMIAYPTTVTGSIGVILQTVSVKNALGRLGVQAEAITSGPNKDVGSFLSVMTEEHRQILQSLVDDFYARFVMVVKQARPGIPADRLAPLVDGRVLSGTQALDAGLVDELGDLHDAFVAAKKLARIPRAELIVYHRPLEYVGSPYAAASTPRGGGTQVNLAQFNFSETGLPGMGGANAGFFYLWDPSLR